MGKQKSKNIIEILMESRLYSTLSIEERSVLIARLAECYPFLIEDDDEDKDVACDID